MRIDLKKYLSYIIVVLLALGLGLTSAYAVGIDDSESFVTVEEWTRKFNAMETSLSEVKKTIYDTNSDFNQTNSRIQLSTVDGMWNISDVVSDTGVGPVETGWSFNSNLAYQSRYSMLSLIDTVNGQQIIANLQNLVPNSEDIGNDTFFYLPKIRYALKDDYNSNTYLIVTIYSMSNGRDATHNHCILQSVDTDVDKQDFSSQKTIKITLPKKDWIITDSYINGDNIRLGGINTLHPRTNVGHFGLIANGKNYFDNYETFVSFDDATKFMPDTSYSTCEESGSDKLVWTFEFGEGCFGMTTSSDFIEASLFPVLKKDMKSLQYGGFYDQVAINIEDNDTNTPIRKVYSISKGCNCLKNKINGEIPILNE